MQYRVTRPDAYPAGTPSESMQGHYVQAATPKEARERISARLLMAARICLYCSHGRIVTDADGVIRCSHCPAMDASLEVSQ